MPPTDPSDASRSEQDSFARLLTDLEACLRTEEQVFGGILLPDDDTTARSVPMNPSAAAPAVEMSLFEGPRSPVPPLPAEPWAAAPSLEELNGLICTCLKCPLGHTRTKFVFGVGNPRATLMLIGEAPGADEDLQGEPFVGRAGQLLNKILEAVNFRRDEVYIANILKCRPPNNRNPLPEEAELCLPYLRKQVELIGPKAILCLGLVAAQNLLGTKESLGRLRGRVLQFGTVPVMVTYHPAALLRNPAWKRPAWEDVQALRRLHDERCAQ
jgi:DNA polymerase